MRPAIVASVCAYSGNVDTACYDTTSFWDAAKTLVEEWDVVLADRWFEVYFPGIYEAYDAYARLSDLLDAAVQITAQRLRNDIQQLTPFVWNRAQKMRDVDTWEYDTSSRVERYVHELPITQDSSGATSKFRFACGIACQQMKDIAAHGESGWDRQERGRPERTTPCIRYTKGCD